MALACCAWMCRERIVGGQWEITYESNGCRCRGILLGYVALSCRVVESRNADLSLVILLMRNLSMEGLISSRGAKEGRSRDCGSASVDSARQTHWQRGRVGKVPEPWFGFRSGGARALIGGISHSTTTTFFSFSSKCFRLQ